MPIDESMSTDDAWRLSQCPYHLMDTFWKCLNGGKIPSASALIERERSGGTTQSHAHPFKLREIATFNKNEEQSLRLKAKGSTCMQRVRI